jgi:hypothetical protein
VPRAVRHTEAGDVPHAAFSKARVAFGGRVAARVLRLTDRLRDREIRTDFRFRFCGLRETIAPDRT